MPSDKRYAVVIQIDALGIRCGYWVTPVFPSPCQTVYQVPNNYEDLKGTNWHLICGPVTVEKQNSGTPSSRLQGDLYEVS